MLSSSRHNAKNQFEPFCMDQLSLPRPGAGRRIYALLRDQIADGTLPAGAPRAVDPGPGGRARRLAHRPVTASPRAARGRGLPAFTSGGPCRAHREPADRGNGAALRHPVAAPGPRPRCRPTAAGSPRWRRLPAHRPSRRASTSFYGAVASRDFPALVCARAYQAELLRQQHSLSYVRRPKATKTRGARCRVICGAREADACDAAQIVVVTCRARSRASTCARAAAARSGRCLRVREPRLPDGAALLRRPRGRRCCRCPSMRRAWTRPRCRAMAARALA